MTTDVSQSPDIIESLNNFMTKWIDLQKTSHISLEIEYDEQWPSPAILVNSPEGNVSQWRPVIQSEDNSLQALNQGLDIEVNPQLEAYYTRYWSDNLNASALQGGLQLLFPWNEDDFVRLQENLIAHVLMKRRLGQRDTLFFAVTDEEDFVLSILNETGEVVLEQVGKEPKETLAADLSSFLASLKPEGYNK